MCSRPQTKSRIRRALIVAAIGYLLIGDGIVSRLVYHGQPSFSLYRSTVKQAVPVAVVVFVGIQSDADEVIRPVLPQLQAAGDVLVVRYPRHRHDPTRIVMATDQEVRRRGYRQVIVVAQSMGAMLAGRFVSHNLSLGLGEQLSLRLLLHDPAAGRQHLVNRRWSWLAWLFRPGPLWNIVGRVLVPLASPGHQPAQIGPDADLSQIAQADNTGRHWPISSLSGQIREAAFGPVPLPGQFARVPAAIIRSNGRGSTTPDSDGTLLFSASSVWADAVRVVGFQRVDAAHNDCLGRPAACQAAYIQALRSLQAAA